ncbi:30S ribosomal protein S12 methylthiotransferase RimO [Mesosutterella sp. OilRF-GAM-744-9]|uniref:Ribosomal protein uS12 methylthiotransferase RimO n=1 Tax=Mesosutterella porci TaxID=2915351 RepID=A0ABS9MQH5_9BURK|nr:30S ribosomal protein S12 methylthiotransferase RimO [Mesosutterella sp. oilRF-744-WT-GAM-9]MCG5030860.1 30S ribosomal protein S12 methylthiotransferase RimO [Mesosutterella sp. oilRF-744-WT-GAM-9]MCI6530441.1 30S ribosomal protein S12 methylthiotransferase RimO [Mesosutterella sp.]
MTAHIPTIGFVSLGCAKALVDTERVITELRAEGYRIAGDYKDSDLVIINTCGFINEAIAESLDAVAEALRENGRVIVMGCLGGKKNADGSNYVKELHPAVLGVVGPEKEKEVLELVHRHLPAPHPAFGELRPGAGVRLTPHHYAYLKISEGCNNHCTFCIIPQLRGRLVSRPMNSIMMEAEALKEDGVKEIMVIAEDTPAYGSDLGYRLSFAGGRPVHTRIEDLCRELGRLGLWIRLHYVYPYPAVDRIIPLMAEGKILPYLDMPLQHSDPEVLRAMARPAHADRTLERIEAWRKLCPDLTLRSTFIVGFPGETERQFENLLEFLREAQLDRVGCFAYSPVEGAKANSLPGAVPEEVKEERRKRLMELQAEISAAKLARRVGGVEKVLIDEPENEDGVAVGRTVHEAPEVDGVVYVTTKKPVNPGDFVEAKIVRTEEHDLVALRVDGGA